MNVFEEEGVVDYLKARNITQPYLKAKRYLELGYFGQVDLRKKGVFYFRITKKYCALVYFASKDTFIVVEITDYQ